MRFARISLAATVAEFVEWFPGVDEAQVRDVLEHEAKGLRKALVR